MSCAPPSAVAPVPLLLARHARVLQPSAHTLPPRTLIPFGTNHLAAKKRFNASSGFGPGTAGLAAAARASLLGVTGTRVTRWRGERLHDAAEEAGWSLSLFLPSCLFFLTVFVRCTRASGFWGGATPLRWVVLVMCPPVFLLPGCMGS